MQRYKEELQLFWFNFRYIYVFTAISVLLSAAMMLRAPLLLIRSLAGLEAVAIAVGLVLPWLKLRKLMRSSP